MKRGRWQVLLLLEVWLVACDDASEPGLLNRGLFFYDCTGVTDAYCEDFFSPEEFPPAQAVGGPFKLTFVPDDPELPIPRVESAALDLIERNVDILRFLQPGRAAVLAMLEDEVVDYRYLDGKAVTQLRLEDESTLSLAEVRLDTGETVSLRVVPQDEFDRILGGGLSFSWEILDYDVAEFASEPTERDVGVTGVAPGSTELRITTEGYSATFPIIVREAAP